jgi:hypothetical protein
VVCAAPLAAYLLAVQSLRDRLGDSFVLKLNPTFSEVLACNSVVEQEAGHSQAVHNLSAHSTSIAVDLLTA